MIATTYSELCKCNMCDSILIDENPQINAIQYPLEGVEIPMVQIISEEIFWGCPNCLTDDYLTDL